MNLRHRASSVPCIARRLRTSLRHPAANIRLANLSLDNWQEVFQEAFDRPESVRESLHRLGPVRLCTMHARAITKTELMLAIAEVTRLLIAIGYVDSCEDTD